MSIVLLLHPGGQWAVGDTLVAPGSECSEYYLSKATCVSMMLCGLSQHQVTLLVITVSESHRMARMLSSQVTFAIIQFNFSYRNGQVNPM